MKRPLLLMVILTLSAVALGAACVHRGLAEDRMAQLQKRAALLVQFGDGDYVARCISFHEEAINGLELLMRSGLKVVTWGGAVCRIDDEGCDYPDRPCFCQCQGSSCHYWSYWHWRNDRWVYAQTGSADHLVRDGDAEAWLWGTAQIPPAALSFATICASTEAVPGADANPVLSQRTDAGQVVTQETGNRRSPGAPVGQYAIFLGMAFALVAGFWVVRRRHRE